MLGDLKRAQKDVDDNLSSFGRMVICKDLASVKRDHGDNLTSQLNGFVSTMDPMIAKLQKSTNMLLAMHAARGSVV